MLRSLTVMMSTVLLALALLGSGMVPAVAPAVAQHVSLGAMPGAIPGPAPSVAEPARLCGTNSSRSRRCFFGNRECLRNGHSKAECDKALAICHSCIDGMVACARQPSSSCGVCYERYGACMQPWVAIIE